MKKDLSVAGYEAKLNRIKDASGRYRKRFGSETKIRRNSSEHRGATLLGEIEEEKDVQAATRKASDEKQHIDLIKNQFQQFTLQGSTTEEEQKASEKQESE